MRTILSVALVLLFALVIGFATRSPGGPIDFVEFGNWLGPASDMLAGKIPRARSWGLDFPPPWALLSTFERTNPTRFYQAPTIAPFQEEVIRDLARNPPSAVLLTSETWLDPIDGRPNADRIPRVRAFVNESYPVRVRVGTSTVGLPGRSLSGS